MLLRNIKLSRLFLPLATALLLIANFACKDTTSEIGESLIQGNVKINIDTTIFNLQAVTVAEDTYDSRSGSLMIGNISVPEYGELSCSFVSRLMPRASLSIADTLPQDMIDSCKVFVRVFRGNITGDSLAPQRLAVYKLTKQLPSSITNAFDPTGYYDAAKPLGSKSFVMSNIGLGDTAYIKGTYIPIDVEVPVEIARDAFREYKENPSIFAWPQTFAKYFPGLFVKSTFGKGCISTVSQLMVVGYYRYNETTKKTTNGVTKDTVIVKNDSVALFSATPEVLSSNNIHLKVAQSLRDRVAKGEHIITTPGGYITKIKFPAREIIEQYKSGNKNLSIISSLAMNLPATVIENTYDIGTSPYLLMILSKEVDTFFNENKLPDDKTSFSAQYDAVNKCYSFGTLRDYIINLLNKQNIEDEDIEFSLIPVNITGETSGTDSYYSTSTYYVTKCLPYMERPTMTLVDTKNAEVIFTFSSQEL